LEQVIRNMI